MMGLSGRGMAECLISGATLKHLGDAAPDFLKIRSIPSDMRSKGDCDCLRNTVCAWLSMGERALGTCESWREKLASEPVAAVFRCFGVGLEKYWRLRDFITFEFFCCSWSNLCILLLRSAFEFTFS